jgi:hypothetical protein
MTSIAEIQSSIKGCISLAKGEENALKYFNLSSGGFWSSFIAVVLGLLIAALQAYLEIYIFNKSDIPAVPGLKDEPLEFSVLPIVIMLVSWLSYLCAVFFISRSAGFTDKFWTFVIVYNWSQLTIIGIWFVLSVFILGTVGIQFFSLAFFLYLIASYFYLWYMTLRTLETSALMAVGIISIEFLITVTFIVLF